MENTGSGSWHDVGDILNAFNSVSRLSKGTSPIQTAENLYSRNIVSSPEENGKRTHINNGYAGNLRVPSPHDTGRLVGMGRGKYFREIEKKLETTPERLDLNIHSELREIGCGYSNEAIEQNWGCSSLSSSQSSPIKLSSTSDEESRMRDYDEDSEIGFFESKNGVNGNESGNEILEVAALLDNSKISSENLNAGEPMPESMKPTPKSNRQRKCRNLVVLNMEIIRNQPLIGLFLIETDRPLRPLNYDGWTQTRNRSYVGFGKSPNVINMQLRLLFAQTLQLLPYQVNAVIYLYYYLICIEIVEKVSEKLHMFNVLNVNAIG